MSALMTKAATPAPQLLRVSLGVMYLTHSLVLKVFTFGFAGTAGYFASLGLPGVQRVPRDRGRSHRRRACCWRTSPPAGSSLAAAADSRRRVLGHAGNGWVFSAAGGGWEYPLFLIVVSVAVALQAFAVAQCRNRRPPRRLARLPQA